MFKYILFDFDGTLVDTNDLVILALNETAKKFTGEELSSDKLNSILGKYLVEQMRCICESKHEEMALYYKEFYNKNKDIMTKYFEGTKEMLGELKSSGCKIAVVSAKGRNGIEHGLEMFNLSGYVDAIVSAYDVENNKPHPEPALKALEMLGGDTENALLVGDSPYDILCGKNAGIKTVLVGWTIFPKEEIIKLNPDYIVNTPLQLPDIVKYVSPE